MIIRRQKETLENGYYFSKNIAASFTLMHQLENYMST